MFEFEVFLQLSLKFYRHIPCTIIPILVADHKSQSSGCCEPEIRWITDHAPVHSKVIQGDSGRLSRPMQIQSHIRPTNCFFLFLSFSSICLLFTFICGKIYSDRKIIMGYKSITITAKIKRYPTSEQMVILNKTLSWNHGKELELMKHTEYMLDRMEDFLHQELLNCTDA